MNIYEYIPSPDVAAYCEKIGHVFTPLEMAVLIEVSKKTFKEKIVAWRALIADFPDMPIPKKEGFKKTYESLHEYLEEYITFKEKTAEAFLTPVQNEVYHSHIWRQLGFYDRDEKNCGGCYTTFENAWEEVKEWDKIDCIWRKGYRADIKKYKLDSDGYYMLAKVDSNMELLDISCMQDDDFPELLGEFCIYIPLPFEKGDILIDCIGKPFVLDDLIYWCDQYKNRPLSCDGWDMQAAGYFFHNGKFGWDHGFRLPELQYFTGELQGQEQFLKYMSAYLKSDVKCPHGLLGAYEQYELEYKLNENRKQFEWMMKQMIKNKVN